MVDNQKYWFVACTPRNQELTIRDTLVKMGIEHFLPTQIVVRQLKYRKKKVEVPVIKNLIFIHDSKCHTCEIANDFGVKIFYIHDRCTRSMLIVPDKQMKDFMFVMDLDPNKIQFDNDIFRVGTKVQVIKGDLSGVEGELLSISNKAYVMIRIPQVLTASFKVPKSYLRVVSG